MSRARTSTYSNPQNAGLSIHVRYEELGRIPTMIDVIGRDFEIVGTAHPVEPFTPRRIRTNGPSVAGETSLEVAVLGSWILEQILRELESALTAKGFDGLHSH